MASDAASSSPDPQPPLPPPQSVGAASPPSPSIRHDAVTTASTVPNTSTPKGGRRSKYTAQEDLTIVREVAASKAHIAAYGQTRPSYELVAAACNANTAMTCKVAWKQCQDRYERLQETHDREDGLTHLRCGIGGGALSEVNELLSQMKEARDDLKKEKTARKEKVLKDEEEKEKIGMELVAAALSRKNKTSSEDNSGEKRSGSDERKSKERRKRRKIRSVIGGELAAFGESLKESDIARYGLEPDMLAFQRHRFDSEREEREKDREKRRLERKEQNELEFKKMDVIFGAFKAQQK